jgi:LytS/YehU family sensor histidine kinase
LATFSAHLKKSDAQLVDFDQELQFLKCYLDIEYIRFQDRLTVEMDIDPYALTATVPNLILQRLLRMRCGMVSRLKRIVDTLPFALTARTAG